MDSEYRIVLLPPSLAARLGLSHLLVEALALVGGAVLRAAYLPPPLAMAGRWVCVPPRCQPIIERLFAAAAEVSYVDARHAPRSAGPVAHTRPRVSRPGRHL